MSEPFLGEIRMFANGYAPRNWMFCEGQILQIKSYQALYTLLGAVYGGDGVTTFALPDYRGRVPVHVSASLPLGTAQGEETHTLVSNEMPEHTHTVQAYSQQPGDSPSPLNNVWAGFNGLYGPAATLTPMNAQAISTAGLSQAHSNMQPYLTVNFAIAIAGIYPSQN
ncbi:phage tail protein [Tumebacillus algifaecis]|uniref:Phage tail protein n=1 Tax=Tumebacillus algifaecis TaxID=1214604 RepID=A0A223CWP3_9BACL|nr:tail fiber protein [Tumebacillus algifaecis]ASS73706.1 phage tail protein [Tumebacillus algifaecis]